MPTVLITGGAGFIGCRLATELLRRGDGVDVLDNLHPQVHPDRTVPADLPAGARLLPGDVTHATAWPAVLATSRPDTIVHLAAETGTGQSLTEPTRHANVNVVGTAAMIEAIENSGRLPGHIVLASSRAVYGDGAWQSQDGATFYPGHRTAAQLDAKQWDYVGPDGGTATPLPSRAATTLPAPTNVYAATKLAQEHILAAWCQARDVKLSILRFQNVYGPGQSITNSYTGVLTFFARAALAGQAIDVYEDGEIVRDFVHVDDVVDAVATSVSQPGDRLLDIGSGQRRTILDAARVIAAQAGAPEPAISGRFRHGDVRAAWCVIDDAKRELGYDPAWDLERGVASVLDWMRTVDHS